MTGSSRRARGTAVLGTKLTRCGYESRDHGIVGSPLDPRGAGMNKADAVWILVHTRYPDEGLSTEQQKQLDEQFVFVKQIEFNEAYAKLYERKSATRGAPR